MQANETHFDKTIEFTFRHYSDEDRERCAVQ